MLAGHVSFPPLRVRSKPGVGFVSVPRSFAIDSGILMKSFEKCIKAV